MQETNLRTGLEPEDNINIIVTNLGLQPNNSLKIISNSDI